MQETISAEQLNSTPIQFPVQLEQLSMEGSYHKVMMMMMTMMIVNNK